MLDMIHFQLSGPLLQIKVDFILLLFSPSLGTNRFEVTLEKSNKNFSKKIQQVGMTA